MTFINGIHSNGSTKHWVWTWNIILTTIISILCCNVCQHCDNKHLQLKTSKNINSHQTQNTTCTNTTSTFNFSWFDTASTLNNLTTNKTMNWSNDAMLPARMHHQQDNELEEQRSVVNKNAQYCKQKSEQVQSTRAPEARALK